MKSTYILLLAGVIATACDNNINGSNEVKANGPALTAPTLPLTDTSKTNTVNQTTVALPTATTTQPASALNPAHGQPGHRCDVAVGAPLNAAAPASPGNANVPSTPIVNTQPSTIQPAQNSAAAKPPTLQLGGSNATSGAKLNPPHGQPGHDCSVEVGKPLKQ